MRKRLPSNKVLERQKFFAERAFNRKANSQASYALFAQAIFQLCFAKHLSPLHDGANTELILRYELGTPWTYKLKVQFKQCFTCFFPPAVAYIYDKKSIS